MIKCLDCGKWVPDEQVVYSTLDAYAPDGDFDMLCPFCGNNQLVEVEDDGESLGEPI